MRTPHFGRNTPLVQGDDRQLDNQVVVRSELRTKLNTDNFMQT
jgi:hypothetical protein